MEQDYEVQRSLGRIEGGITEIKSEVKLMRDDHTRLRQEFSSLEAGRLTRLESQFAVHQAEMSVKAKNTAIIYSTVIGIISSVATAIIINFIVK